MKTVLVTIAILLLLIAGCIVEYWHDKKHERSLMSSFDYAWLIAAMVAFFLALAIIIPKYAQAHDHARPELNPWLESLRGRGGAHCCDDKDTTHVDDLDWGTQDKPFEAQYGASTERTHFWVNIEGKKYDVPDSALVDGPNKEGMALVWYIRIWETGSDSHFVVRCFMPGTLS